jgi:transposase
MAVGMSRRAVQDWVYRYNDRGLEGLQEHRGAANAPTLTPAQEQQFCQRVEAGLKPEDRVCSLRGREFQRILKEEFGVWRSLASTYLLLHELGYSCLRPRPKHRKADEEKQAGVSRRITGFDSRDCRPAHG